MESTSASAEIMETGVRRSWPASMTNCRCACCDLTMGATMRLESRAKSRVTPRVTPSETSEMDTRLERTPPDSVVLSRKAMATEPSLRSLTR